MHTLRGVVLSAQGGTRCDISRTYHGANTEFIAPRTGHYRFSTEGTTTLEVGAVCGAPMCQRGMGSLNAEIDLMAGQHIPINTGVNNGTRNAPFSMSVLVP